MTLAKIRRSYVDKKALELELQELYRLKPTFVLPVAGMGAILEANLRFEKKRFPKLPESWFVRLRIVEPEPQAVEARAPSQSTEPATQVDQSQNVDVDGDVVMEPVEVGPLHFFTHDDPHLWLIPANLKTKNKFQKKEYLEMTTKSMETGDLYVTEVTRFVAKAREHGAPQNIAQADALGIVLHGETERKKDVDAAMEGDKQFKELCLQEPWKARWINFLSKVRPAGDSVAAPSLWLRRLRRPRAAGTNPGPHTSPERRCSGAAPGPPPLVPPSLLGVCAAGLRSLACVLL